MRPSEKIFVCFDNHRRSIPLPCCTVKIFCSPELLINLWPEIFEIVHFSEWNCKMRTWILKLGFNDFQQRIIGGITINFQTVIIIIYLLSLFSAQATALKPNRLAFVKNFSRFSIGKVLKINYEGLYCPLQSDFSTYLERNQ